MEIKFNAKDTVRIPDGCKAIIEDGMVIFVKEESKEQEFEDGDVLHSKFDKTMLIFNNYENGYTFTAHRSSKYLQLKNWNINAFRHATEEEKHQFFVKMKEQGLQWNAEEKRVEKIRWRAEKGEDYYSIDGFCYLRQDREEFQLMDDKIYNNYNYFRTEKQAQEAASRVKETLRKYHEEIGE